MMTMTVKAKDGAVVYDIDGNRIPDRFVHVQMSPGIIKAINNGDLEEAEGQAESIPRKRAQITGRS